jgi:hypothetical protein
MMWWPFLRREDPVMADAQARLKKADDQNFLMHARARSKAVDHVIREDVATSTLRALLEEMDKKR